MAGRETTQKEQKMKLIAVILFGPPLTIAIHCLGSIFIGCIFPPLGVAYFWCMPFVYAAVFLAGLRIVLSSQIKGISE
jgi:hypothetical protein